MTSYRFAVIVEVDDEALAAHDGSKRPPPNDPRDWYGGDLVEALNECYATIEHDQLEVLPALEDDER